MAEHAAMVVAVASVLRLPSSRPTMATNRAVISMAMARMTVADFSGLGLGFWDGTHEEADFEFEVEGEVVFGEVGVPVGVIAVLSFFDLEGLEVFVIGASGKFNGVEDILNGLPEFGLDTYDILVERVRKDVVGVVGGLERVVVSGHE